MTTDNAKGAWKGFFQPLPLVTLFWGARGQSKLRVRFGMGLSHQQVSTFHCLTSSCRSCLKWGWAASILRCDEGVSGMKGGTVSHPEYFLPLFSFDDNRNQCDPFAHGWMGVFISTEASVWSPFLARECLLLNLASGFPLSACSFCFDVCLTV